MTSSAPHNAGGAEDRDARLRQLALGYTAPLKRYFVRRGVPQDAAEDCAQDVFLRIARADGGTIENAEAYLFTIAAAVVIDRARKLKSHHAAYHVPIENYALEGGEPGPIRVLEGREDLLRLKGVLDELPARTREIFLLNRLEGLTYTQLAARFGVTIKAIEKQMSRVLAHLRQRYSHDI